MKSLRFFVPRIEYALFAAIFWGVAASGPKILNFDGDLPRHILMGNLILQTHHISTTDMFSFRTLGYPSIPHEWLAQVLFALACKWLELSGIVIMTALIVMLTWSLVYYESLRQSNSFFAALLLTALAAGASQIHVLPRPHLFTYLLTAAWVVLLERINENHLRAWWPLPLVMLLWVNLHGMFVIGLIILAIYCAGEFLEDPSEAWFSSTKAKALMVGGALSLVATFLSPAGTAIWAAIISLGRSAYITSRIPEYQPANFHMPETWPFIALLLFVMIGFARTTKKVAWKSILMVVSFTGLALYTSRMIPLFAIAVTPIAAGAFANWLQNEYPQSRLFTIEKNLYGINSSSNGLIWLALIIMIVTLLFHAGKAINSEGRGNAFDPSFFPVKATGWLREHPPSGRMFNEFDWGGYLLLKLWPAHQIFMDGHTHIYGEELTREYEKIKTLDKDWQAALKKYDVNWAIIRPNEPLANALQESLGWVIAYQDETAIILIGR